MPFDRSAALTWLRSTPEVPVLIVGGGINGASVLRELGLRGVDTLLVERADFAVGATGASSRMIHGGLRYLENGEFRLVREALHERNRLLQNAPHCVFPLRTVIPLFSRASGLWNAPRKFLNLGGKPSRRGAWLVRAGLWMYRRFAGRDENLPPPSMQGARAALAERPGLHPAIIGTATYVDAWNPQPERLCLEVLEDATDAHAGIRALNYVALAHTAGAHVILRDETTGEEFRLRPRVVVNATGAWVDQSNQRLGTPSAFIGGTKGSHLVVDHPELLAQTAGAEIFYENEDGRICLILPLHGRVLIGTTDIRAENPDLVRCEEDEVAYLLNAVREVFPAIDVRREHVIARFSGVRPLPRSAEGFTGRISRDHMCHVTPPDAQRGFALFSLVGGKWTTFRAFGEGVARRVLAHLGVAADADSRHLAIGGGRDHPAGHAERHAWIAATVQQHAGDVATVTALFARHGTRAARIAAHMRGTRWDGAARIGPYFAGELDFVLGNEAVLHLDDLVVRRTTLGLFGNLDRAGLERCAELAAQALSWDRDRKLQEIERTQNILRERHGVTLADRVKI